MSARDHILNKLRIAQQPFSDIEPIAHRRHMVPEQDLSDNESVARFIMEAEKLGCYVYQLNRNDAFEQVMELIGTDKSVLSWKDEFIPMDALHESLASVDVDVAKYDDRTVRVGITGVTAALSATGSLIVESGAGRFRTTSLLPDLHIAILTPDQILPDIETWQTSQQEAGYPAFRQSSNTTIITGPSKTADIAQELIKGAHGPREVHIFIVS